MSRLSDNRNNKRRNSQNQNNERLPPSGTGRSGICLDMVMYRRVDNPENDRPQQNDAGRSGICFPYNDFFVMSSQILAIMATIGLWMYIKPLLMSVFAMVLHQVVVFAYHMDKIKIRALPVVSFLASFGLFSHGMITLVMLILETLEDLEYEEEDAKVDGCNVELDRVILAFVACLGSMFWMGSYLCMSSFVERARNAQWQALVIAASESDNAKKRNSRITTETEDEAEAEPDENA